MKKIIFLGLSSVFCFLNLSAQSLMEAHGSGSYVYIERTDLRRYDNGKYTGLVSREVHSYVTPSRAPAGASKTDRFYDGHFLIDENTLRNSEQAASGINASIPSSFKITRDGQLIMVRDNGFPSFRSFPTFTREAVKPGDRWQAKAERAVDPLNKGIVTKMPIHVEYTYLKDDFCKGEEVYVLSAQWATRYGISYFDYSGDRDLKSAQGSHKATMFISKRTGSALVVRDMVDETFIFNDGNQVAFKGTISLFTEYPPAFDRSKILPSLQRIASLSDSQVRELAKKDKTEEPQKDRLAASKPDSADSARKELASAETGAIKDSGRNRQNELSGTGAPKAQETGSSSNAGTAGQNPSAHPDNSREESLSGQQAAGVQIAKNDGKPAENGTAGQRESQGTKSGKKSDMLKERMQKATETSESQDSAAGKPAKEEPPVTVQETEAGICLTLPNLKFKPDSSELLPGESKRLDQIAQVLKEAPDQMLMVEGHTASTGNPKGEMNLSLERANSIAKALIARGIPAQKFITKGAGGTKPVASNSTPEGKSANRRVEITILE